MKAAGIDLGRVRVGLAVTDDLGKMAHPRPHLDGRDPKRLLDSLAALAEAENVTTFVLGLPRTLGGREGPPARRARKFAERLRERTGLAVELVDEWWTTKEALARLRDQGVSERDSRERVDSAAAALLLQGWLDSRQPRSPECSNE